MNTKQKIKGDKFFLDINKLCEKFLNNYNKNQPVNLDSEQKNMLDKITTNLENIVYKLKNDNKINKNFEFKPDGFKIFICKVLNNNNMNGGDDEGRMVPHNNINNGLNRYDFIYTFIFFIGIFLIYTSYAQICLLTETLTGNSIGEVGESIQNIFNELLQEYRTENQENICFRQQIMLLIGIISGQIRERIYNSIQVLINDFLNNSMSSAATQALQQCRTDVFSNSNLFGQTGNLIASAASVMSGEYTQCLNTMTQRNIERVISIETQNLQDLLALFRTQSSSIITFLRVGTGMIFGSASYLIYRGPNLMYNIYIRFRLNGRQQQVNISRQLIRNIINNPDVTNLEVLLGRMTIENEDDNEDDNEVIVPVGPAGGSKSKRRKSNMKNKKYTKKQKKYTKKNRKIKQKNKKNRKIKKTRKK